MLKYKIGDKIKITAGKDKGKTGKIEKIFPKRSRVLIPDTNLYKKHVKGFKGQKGGIYEIPRPLPFSSIALVCQNCKKATRVGFDIRADKKIRVCKKCNQEIIYKTKK